MRELKFRVWDVERKVWLSEDTLMDLSGTLCANDAQTLKGNYEITQFTGEKDKNGTEIFEGDILKYYEQILEVKYSDGGFEPLSTSGYEEGTPSSDIKIIGNIFQHPELMNKKTMK